MLASESPGISGRLEGTSQGCRLAVPAPPVALLLPCSQHAED
jgi:hypothetical protein